MLPLNLRLYIINGKASEDFYRHPPLTDWCRKYGCPHKHEDLFISYVTKWIKHDVLSRCCNTKTQKEYNKICENTSIEIIGWDYNNIFN